ncbi:MULTISPECIES: phosphate ABC transporter permease PstA [Larsenimonas]|uniref:Phosphate transport system permease protein PstA n=1 Tax=Larsenimonas suaedae TaxID=1851019 RepID=A0ABU1GWV5_9GAMM|nr:MULTISPECIES: phosphate ABC transporter permease PstA [Larsenimonas]MCM2973082.1 phosphate ABC transporter permease PstA [Larsenimonas suaedae]MCM5705039.1 phosphate ABC transporter permease PstA [Larsenimonas salina]MDR5896519.1 phosphate ABC transporter permease PstA [Larsenimonas suaedae]
MSESSPHLTPSNPVYRRRRLFNRVVMAFCMAAAAFGIIWLLLILFSLVTKGASALELSVFTERTKMTGGGLGNAILGSLIMTTLATIVGTIVGVAAGTWLAEYGGKSRLASFIRFINDVLLSAPSIIVGLYIYAILVLPSGHFSGWAGVAALAVLIIPVVIRSTEDMLKLVPNSLREAASALGAHRWLVVCKVCYSGARAGIITGILLGCARISGETAPLIFTSLNSNQWNFFDLNSEMPNLPMTLYQNMTINSFIPRQVELAWAGALILTVAILLLNIVARVVSERRKG